MDAKQQTGTDRWLNRNVIGLAVNRFLSDLGHEAGTSVLPLFLAAIGAPAMALGLIEGVADALSSFTKLIGGWLGDRVERRKPWAAGGYLLTGVTTGLFGLFAWWPWILGVRAIGWAGRGLRSPLHDALLTDSVPASARGRAFGFDEAADTAGAVAGPLVALAIVGLMPTAASSLHGFNLIFWLAAIPGILAALSIVALVSERPHPVLKGTSFLGALRLLPPSYRRYLAGVFVFGCGDFSHTMLILYAVQALTPRYGQGAGAIAIELYALHNVLYAVGSYPVGALADRYGKRGFLLAAYSLAAFDESHSDCRGAVDCHARRRLRPGRGRLCASAVARTGDRGGPYAGRSQEHRIRRAGDRQRRRRSRVERDRRSIVDGGFALCARHVHRRHNRHARGASRRRSSIIRLDSRTCPCRRRDQSSRRTRLL